jgi:hypothetical protein
MERIETLGGRAGGGIAVAVRGREGNSKEARRTTNNNTQGRQRTLSNRTGIERLPTTQRVVLQVVEVIEEWWVEVERAQAMR